MPRHYATEAGQAFAKGGDRGRHITPERLALLHRCKEEEWPIQEIIRTYGISYHTVMRYMPDYPRATAQQGELSALARKFNALCRKHGLEA